MPTLSRTISEETKTVAERFRAATALIRQWRCDRREADPDSGCRLEDSSRRRTVRSAAERPFFRAAKREAETTATAPAEPAVDGNSSPEGGRYSYGPPEGGRYSRLPT